MTADEVQLLREALVERYPYAPDDAAIEATWVNALAVDDFGEMATALACWYGRHPNRPPTIAELREEPRVDVAESESRVMRLARAAYEAECARQGRRPRTGLFGGAA